MKRKWIIFLIILAGLFCKQEKLVFATSLIKPEKVLTDHSSWIFSIAVSKDGKYFASASRDKTINIYNSTTKSLIKTLKGHDKDVNSICFSPDSRYIVSGSDDSNVLIWDLQNGKIIKTLKEHKGIVYSVKYSPNGNYIISGGADSKVILWDAKTGEKVKVFIGHSSYVRSVCFSSDGDLIASAGNDQLIRIWSVKQKKLIKIITGIEIQNDTANKKYTFNLKHIDAITDICFSPDNKYVITSSFDKTIRIFSLTNNEFKGNNRVLAEHEDKVCSISFSNNGKYMVSASVDKTIIIWDANTFKVISKFKAHNSWIFTAVFSKDDKYILSGGMEQILKIWDVNKILKDCRVPAYKPILIKGQQIWGKWEYYDDNYYIKISLLEKENNSRGFIYRIFNRKTKSFLMEITVDFCESLSPSSQHTLGPGVTGITVFPNLKYFFTSTGQNISFFINLELLIITPIKNAEIAEITKDFKYCIFGISSPAGELSSNISSVGIYEINSEFNKITILEGQYFGYEYFFEKMSNDNKKIIILKSPHVSAKYAPEESKIDIKYSYRETYSFPDLRLLSSIKVENRN